MIGASLTRLCVLVRRERIELLRDRISLAILVGLPLVTLVLFTFALATDVKHMTLAVFDAADSPRSRAIVQAIGATGYFDVQHAASLASARAELAAGAVGGALVIAPDVEERFAHGEGAQAELLLDGSQAILAANAEAILAATVAAFDVRVRRDFASPVPPPSGNWPVGWVEVVERALYNPRLDSEHYMIPGLLGYIFTFLTILVAAVSIVRERVVGTFEQLMVTPVRSWEIIGAKLIVLASALLIDEAIVMVMGGTFFGVWPRGSVVLLFATTVMYLLVTLSIGLIISASSQTPDEAVQKSLVASTPLLNISGLVFPVTSMPYGFQLFAKVLPVYHYLRTSRAIYLTGAGAREVAGHLAVIAAYLVLLGLILLRRLAHNRRS
jgi:drug efflux transport system permease protein